LSVPTSSVPQWNLCEFLKVSSVVSSVLSPEMSSDYRLSGARHPQPRKPRVPIELSSSAYSEKLCKAITLLHQ
jgi:hypothetical protein